jgi:hypothetical protein
MIVIFASRSIFMATLSEYKPCPMPKTFSFFVGRFDLRRQQVHERNAPLIGKQIHLQSFQNFPN